MKISSTVILKSFLFIINLFLTNGFLNLFNFGIKTTANVYEKLTIKLNNKQSDIIKQINGFYGLIGPNIYMDNNVDSLKDLFMGDGLIQGIFFENGNLTYVRHLIKTEKILYEEKYGKLPLNNNYFFLLFVLLNKIQLFPNVLGMANTAILNVKKNDVNNNYALFEQDYPYLIDIDSNNKEIKTVKKINIKSLSHFSGHSKINLKGNIETIDYNIMDNTVSYIQLDNNFKLIENIPFKFKYKPIIHDFNSDDDFIIMIDSPLFMDITKNLQNKIPIYFNQNEKTYIYIYDRKNKNYETYSYENGFYSFHYASLINKKDTIEIYISLYDDINFTNVNINGKYRMIEINKITKKVTIHKNDELEKYNLDFPIKFNDKIISRNIENRKINGFLITKGLNIHKKLLFDNKKICGEHNIIYIKNEPFLIFFNIKEDTKGKTNLITLVNLNSYEMIDIKIENELSLGFHSIFIPN